MEYLRLPLSKLSSLESLERELLLRVVMLFDERMMEPLFYISTNAKLTRNPVPAPAPGLFLPPLTQSTKNQETKAAA
ncbi:hypothetical protein JMJ78_0006785 [Colletotrichum scovillei]|nr:hypothetical protein JMJ78_0006785 [Colletotrichum scovillei]